MKMRACVPPHQIAAPRVPHQIWCGGVPACPHTKYFWCVSPRGFGVGGCLGACVLVVGMTLLCAPPYADAGLAVSPPRVVLQGKPGKTLTGFFEVTNQGEHNAVVVVEPEDWSRGLTGSRGPVNWLTVKPAKLTVRPGKSSKIKYTARIPKDASGELRTQVFFTTESGEGIAMRTRLGAIVYIGIEGSERIEAGFTKVEAFYTASTPGVAQPDRLEIVLRIHNGGNVHIVPEGEVIVRNERGEQAAAVPMPPGWGLLPNEEDAYRAIGHGIALKPGPYTLDIRIVCGGDLRHPITITKQVPITVTEDHQILLQQAPQPTR